MGGYERDPAPWALDGVPADFNGRLLPPDWPRFEAIMQGAVRRVPPMADAEVTRLINGPEAFTPDNEFILGESAVRGFFVAAGFCAHGIAGAGGIGQQVARWIVDGEPELDLWKMDIRRFGPQYRSQAYTLARTYENYATYYDIHYPNEERQAGRPLRLSPAYERARRAGRRLRREVRLGAAQLVRRQRGRGGRGDAGGAGGPAAARLGRRALVDRRSAPRRWPAAGGRPSSTRAASPRSRWPARARAAFLQGLCANDIDRPVGSIVYTQLLNRRGGIESDFTVTRWGEDRFLIVTGTAFGNHDLGWIRAARPGGRLRAAARHHRGPGLPGAVGAAGEGDPRAPHAGRPERRGVPLPHRARDHGRQRARSWRCA